MLGEFVLLSQAAPLSNVFERNIVISFPNKSGQMCISFGTFFEGHGHVVRNNKCIVPRTDLPIILLERCQRPRAVLHNNSYFTSNGKPTVDGASVIDG
jgi:hypothetical protein